MKSLYSRSRKVSRFTEAVCRLRSDAAKFEKILHPTGETPLEVMPNILPTAPVTVYKSRKIIEEEITAALEDDKIYLIGLCGIGGVGKTTMVKKIGNMVRKAKIFEEVVMAVVGRQPDLWKVQEEIGEGLGLNFDEETVSVRAGQLHERLNNAKSVLIILEDVWQRLNLEELGIPSPSTNKGCKIILTSRDQRVCIDMEEKAKIVSMGVLPGEEAWVLFRETACDSIDCVDLRQIATDVVEACKGLPLLLVTVGSALRERDRYFWERANLKYLNQPTPANVPKVLKDVYQPLLLSCSHLESEQCRYFFLLCFVFPQDYSISCETLVRYGVGLEAFDAVGNLGEVRNSVQRMVEDLVNRFLLTKSEKDGNGNFFVKMHDVTHELGTWIVTEGGELFKVSRGSKPKEHFYCNNTRISLISEGNTTLPEGVNCSKLELLHMHFLSEEAAIPEKYFAIMEELKVLDVFRAKIPKNSSLHLLKNLRTLQLHRCKLEEIAMIGMLVNLEILSLTWSELEVLPQEIGQLRNLRILDLNHCSSLRKIRPGVLSGLVQLEELLMLDSFTNWGTEEEAKESRNASLTELAFLTNLVTLHIEVPDAELIPFDFPRKQNLENYLMRIGKRFGDLKFKKNFQKFILFECDEATPILGEPFAAMARNSDHLELVGNGSRDLVNELVASGFQNVKNLKLYDCVYLEHLTNKFQHDQLKAPFHVLETLHLENSSNLREIIYSSPGAGSFSSLKELKLRKLFGLKRLWPYPSASFCLYNLERVEISYCLRLQYVFPLSISESLTKLETLHIINCPVLEDIFFLGEGEAEIEATISKVKLPNLSELWLEGLPNVSHFSKEVNAIEFPALQTLGIHHLPKIRYFCPAKSSMDQQFLFTREVTCPSLRRLELDKLFSAAGLFGRGIPFSNFSALGVLQVQSWHNLKKIFLPQVLKDLINLRELRVIDCLMLEEVIAKEDNEEETSGIKGTLLPRLKKLELSNLPNICTFCHFNGSFELPLLEEIIIKNCPMMETYSFWAPSFQIGISEYNFDAEPFFCKEVTCRSLKILQLGNLNATGILFDPKISIDNFSGIEFLEVRSCHSLKSVFSPQIFRDLINLMELRVIDCSMLQEVISKDVENDKVEEIWIPRLNKLKLTSLPKIRRFCHMNGHLGLPSLEEVTIEDCPTLETFTVRPVARISDNGFPIQSLFNKEVSSKFLKILKLTNLNTATGIFGYGIPIGKFNALEVLEADSCHGLRSLFCSPMFRGLSKLRDMTVKNCKMLLEVIPEQQEEGQSKMTQILFPQLENLELLRLPNIRKFCHVKGKLKFPSLKKLRVKDCPTMETFSLGGVCLPSSILVCELDSKLTDQFSFENEDPPLQPAMVLASSSYAAPILRSLKLTQKPEEAQLSSDEYSCELSSDDSPVYQDEDIFSSSVGRRELASAPSSFRKRVLTQFKKSHFVGRDSGSVSGEKSSDPEDVKYCYSKMPEGKMESEAGPMPAGAHFKDTHNNTTQIADSRFEDLPDILKSCLAYCTLIPLGYEFEKDKLIQMWMAENLISVETQGNDCFDRLVNQEYIVSSSFDNLYGQQKYRISDSKASYWYFKEGLSENRYLRIEDGKLDKSRMALHLSLNEKNWDPIEFEALRSCKQLCTLIIHDSHGSSLREIPRNLFLHLKELRTLDLSQTHIQELPSSIGRVKALHFLDISNTPIKMLPDSIDCLVNLQTLRLRGCDLHALPEGLTKLIKLRHLDFEIASQLSFIPKWMGNLTNLQTLKGFIVGQDDGCSIAELKNLNNIKGSFCILRLESVENEKEAKEAALWKKCGIEKLELRWGDDPTNNSSQAEEKILQWLQPHFSLRELKILSYNGSSLSSWISSPSFTNMVSITLYKCKNCSLLPSIGQLPSLRFLKIFEMSSVTEISHLFYRNVGTDHHQDSTAFPKLEKLTLENMLNLEKWTGMESGDFPCLVEVFLLYCPKLYDLSLVSHLEGLKYLQISHCTALPCLPEKGLPDSLETLIIRASPKATERCRKDLGEDWSKVSSVPSIWIDQEEISSLDVR